MSDETTEVSEIFGEVGRWVFNT